RRRRLAARGARGRLGVPASARGSALARLVRGRPREAHLPQRPAHAAGRRGRRTRLTPAGPPGGGGHVTQWLLAAEGRHQSARERGVCTVKVGVPKEVKNHEYRIAITPIAVHELTAHGHDVYVERGAGRGSQIEDTDYEAAGAKILDSADEVWDN